MNIRKSTFLNFNLEEFYMKEEKIFFYVKRVPLLLKNTFIASRSM